MLAASEPVFAQGVLARVATSGQLRVCIWPAYHGITFRDPGTGQLAGLDVDMARALAQALDVKPVWVDSSFATLIDDVVGGRCDVAMFGVGMLPQRMARLRFTQPYMKSDIYGMALQDSRQIRSWADIDKPGVRVAVQSGTFMEPVMGAHLKQASLVPIKPPLVREAELAAGRVDVFMTDYPYSRQVLRAGGAFKLIRPTAAFFELPYGYAVAPGDEAWLAKVDTFVSDAKRNGSLMKAALVHGLEDIVVKQAVSHVGAGQSARGGSNEAQSAGDVRPVRY